MIKHFHRKKSVPARLLLLLIILVTLAVPVSAYTIPEPTNDFYVNDCAGLLSDESYNYIMNVNVELQEKTKAQVVVATIESLKGADLEEYATEMFRKYKIGDKKENNGVLILLAYEDRKIRIEVGYGLEGAINDAKAGRIMDRFMIPYLKDDLWDEGILNGFDSVVLEISNEYGVEIESNAPVAYKSKTEEESSGSGFDGETYFYLALLIFVIIIAIFSKNSGSGGSGSYSSRSGGFGGGFSGGGFSGGGGSSGGGGASRGF